jgi:hypothetical protein
MTEPARPLTEHYKRRDDAEPSHTPEHQPSVQQD